MATLETSRPAASDRLFGANIGASVSTVIGRMAAWNEARVTRQALSRLSDHELDDIGLSRSDIQRIR